MDFGLVVGTVVYALILIVPTVKILQRAGYSPWLSILAIIPVVNIVAYWVFAFARWPTRRRTL